MKWNWLLLAGLFVARPTLGQEQKILQTNLEMFRSHLAGEQQRLGIPSLGFIIVTDKEILAQGIVGHQDLKKTTKAHDDLVFRVGSVSKLFTDIAVMQLVEEGKLSLDEPVSKYLPEFRPKNNSGIDITLRMLMAHRSGLMREPPLGNYFDNHPPDLKSTVASLNDLPLIYPPKERLKYSNAAIAVVGRVLEVIDKKTFAQAVADRTLKKIGMSQSSFVPNETIKKNLAEAIMWTYHGAEFRAPDFELGEAPAGCLYSTSGDLGRFLQVLMHKGNLPRGELLSEKSLKEMLTLQFAKPQEKTGFGLGFVIGEFQGKQRIGHGGAIYGFSTELAYLPEEKIGVVVLSSCDVTNNVTTRLADLALKCVLDARNGQLTKKPVVGTPLKKETVDLLQGTYVHQDKRIELTERLGKLSILGPRGGYLAEVQFLTAEGGKQQLILDGRLGSGLIIPCDGKELIFMGETYTKISPEKPAPCPQELLPLLGEYGPDHMPLYIYEKDGQPWCLIEWLFLYPLTIKGENELRFSDTFGMYFGENLVFKRDAQGNVTGVTAGGIWFPRRSFGVEEGKVFRIKPLKPVDELLKDALVAQPPVEKGEFQKPQLMEIPTQDMGIKVDLKYATADNFLATPLYPKIAKAYLQKPAVVALTKVQAELKEKGYGLLVYDAYRPWRVTKMFWDAVPEKYHGFVADPKKGSRHNRGCAVDVTLYDLKTGQPVEMVSTYDEFTDRAFPMYVGGTSLQRYHRDLLRRAMEKQGFQVYEGEWWHFDYQDWKRYPIGNQSFEELAK